MKKNVTIEAPAKINLTLDIKGKRADGYHELETVMHQINLVDHIHLQEAEKGVTCRSNSTLIPDDESNLAFQAAELMIEKFGITEGVNIFIEKNIPVGAGLAGGSTNAAAVLEGMNQLFALQVPSPRLQELGATLGSDVPFCLLQGTAVARGRGELLTPLTKGPRLELLLVKPDYQLSTAEVYRQFRMEKITKSPDTLAFLNAWGTEDIDGVCKYIINVLETVSIPMVPEIENIKQQICSLGAQNVLMSGSGPTVFGIFKTQQEARLAWESMKVRYQESFVVSSYR
ncbi:MAG: 4-(cytidine 5'-diphospho)-2-C-methyl-D-erythritol kinase [Bacillota bacterium]|nr:4-(cytidine 5'-diphospho)-2-C-methyl-D-erythritol kinase [Bacillota bacterium]